MEAAQVVDFGLPGAGAEREAIGGIAVESAVVGAVSHPAPAARADGDREPFDRGDSYGADHVPLGLGDDVGLAIGLGSLHTASGRVFRIGPTTADDGSTKCLSRLRIG
ncbi:hypothetical protein [Streptomyces sp. NPDC020996]|uniref:hypothetical protein n=1 Tax=Streptomyces sp. NPDC020996 TaxID=3154791 RepID=UPI0033E19612